MELLIILGSNTNNEAAIYAKDLGKNITKEVSGKVKGAGKGIKNLNPFKK